MESKLLNHNKRRVILHNIGGLFPRTPNYAADNLINREIKESKEIQRLIVKDIIKNQTILSLPTILGYTKEELLTAVHSITIQIPEIYRSDYQRQGTAAGYINIKLEKTIYLPHCHTINNYNPNTTRIHNTLKLDSDELLDLWIKLMTRVDKKIAKLKVNNQVHLLAQEIIFKCKSVKQLLNTWPELEVFIPPQYLQAVTKQKRAVKIHLAQKFESTIQEANKQILIRKLTG